MLNEYATPMRLMMQFSSWMSVRFWSLPNGIVNDLAVPDPHRSVVSPLIRRAGSYSITLSARTIIELGILMPSALAIFKLTVSS